MRDQIERLQAELVELYEAVTAAEPSSGWRQLPFAVRREVLRLGAEALALSEAVVPQEAWPHYSEAQARNTILAALRFYQEHDMTDPTYRDGVIHDIATNGGEDAGLDDEAIDRLCEDLNGGPLRLRYEGGGDV